MPDFLLEIGCEEIPARMIEKGAVALWQGVRTLLEQLRLSPSVVDPSDYGRIFYTPRRLAVLFPGVSDLQADCSETVVGPSLKVAYKDGSATPAAQAFAKKVGQDVTQLRTVSTVKGDYLAADVLRKGRSAVDLLAEMVPSDIFGIPWPKTMYWQQKNDRFVRPIRWLVALFDYRVVPIRAFGVSAQDTTRGHRTLGGPIRIEQANSYSDALKNVKVIAHWKDREHQIRRALDAATRTISGARWREDETLLDTVVNLTEWPSVILGSFDAEFLQLPEEVLVTVMRNHQKYFALEDASGKLEPHFLAVLNTDADPEGIIRHGHERVLRARFNDARFFWQTDQTHPLRERVQWLKNVTFQKDLGSYYEKTLRVQRLCSWLCEIIRHNGVQIRPGIVHKAAHLAKADLTTELVKEFTELQGIVGGLYAAVQELDVDMPDSTRQAIARTVYDHYKPQSVEDSVPRTIEGAVLSIGDKADNIAGMFALGLQPTGSKDPFALRRAANGIVKIIAEHKLPLAITKILRDARAAYQGSEAECRFSSQETFTKSVREFFRERLEFYLRDVLGFKYDVVNAVLAAGSDDIVDVVARANAVKDVIIMPEFQAIAAACKRMRNILRQAEEKQIKPAAKFEYLPESSHEEKNLAAYLEVNAPRIETHRQKKEYGDALLLLSTARERVDSFFDKVMVMAEDERIRANRLALLQTLLREFSTIADFSEIVTEGREAAAP